MTNRFYSILLPKNNKRQKKINKLKIKMAKNNVKICKLSCLMDKKTKAVQKILKARN